MRNALWTARLCALISLATGAWAAPGQTRWEYGQQCAREVSAVPAFSCMAGELVPITVDGQPVDPHKAPAECDRPSLLPAPERGAQGQCVPGTRALVLRDDNRAQISAICRKKVARGLDSPLFDEINVIAHNRLNGKTCWFTAKAQEPLTAKQGLAGAWVPSPTARQGFELLHGASASQQGEPQRLSMPAADGYWLTPKQVAASKPACISCHDSGPFMYSPYIAQTRQLPGDPLGRYRPKAVGQDFQREWWALNPVAISTRGNACTACHRIGSMNSCQVAMWQASGQAPQPGADAWAGRFPQSHWMSPGNLHSRAQWEQQFRSSLDKLAACCANPKGPGCEARPYR